MEAECPQHSFPVEESPPFGLHLNAEFSITKVHTKILFEKYESSQIKRERSDKRPMTCIGRFLLDMYMDLDLEMDMDMDLQLQLELPSKKYKRKFPSCFCNSRLTFLSIVKSLPVNTVLYAVK